VSLIKYIKTKPWYVALFLALSFFVLLGFELWKDRADERENYYVEQLLAKPPRHLNIQAIKKVRDSIAGRDHFRFAVLGDNRYNLKQLKKTLDMIAQDKPDFVIHTGDLTSAGKYKQYMNLLDTIAGFKIPIIFVLGNHDTNKRGIACFLHIFGPVSFYFDINKYRFIFINNTSENAQPEFFRLPEDDDLNQGVALGLDDYQMRGLENLVKGSAHNFIILHIPPPVEIYRFHSFIKNGDNFIALMKQYASRIALVLSGHIHGYGEAEQDGVTYIVTAGAGARLFGPSRGVINKYNYVLVDVTAANISHKVQFVD
jgi:predicted phosphodiesterase